MAPLQVHININANSDFFSNHYGQLDIFNVFVNMISASISATFWVWIPNSFKHLQNNIDQKFKFMKNKANSFANLYEKCGSSQNLDITKYLQGDIQWLPMKS